MAILRCEFGHFYDTGKYAVCPVCARSKRSGKTIADDKTAEASRAADADNDITVAYTAVQQRAYAQPVVGWLVCIKGTEKGRDWRLTAGRNFVGSSLKADIVVPGFASNAANAFSIIYDSRHKTFLAMPGSNAQVYLNDRLLTDATRLNDDDEISAGEIVLCFRSFCGVNTRHWD